MSVNDTWALSDNSAQAACLFHGVLKNGLTGKLTAVKDGVATFTVEGSRGGDRERREGGARHHRGRDVRHRGGARDAP